MRKSLISVALVAIAALAVVGWLRFIHDPQVRRDARQAAADSVALALGQRFTDSLAAYRANRLADSVRDDSIARAAATIRTVAIPRARTRVDTLVAGIPDSAVRVLVTEAVAVERGQWQAAAAADSTRIVGLLYRVATLEELVASGGLAVDSLTKQLQKRGSNSRWSFGVSVGPSVGTKGFDPVTVQVGLHYRI